MQTFLPYPDYEQSAKCLDMKRLGKQRSEVLILLRTLLKLPNGKGWKNHPATKMWEGYEASLFDYGCAICYEWKLRGYRDTVYDKLLDLLVKIPNDHYRHPLWLGDERLHSSHRASLLKKFPVWYSKFGWNEIPEIRYYWPSKENLCTETQSVNVS